MLPEEMEKRMISFIRSIANECKYCNRRSTENCENCHSLWANSIMKEVAVSTKNETEIIDYSLAARIARILLILKTAGHPILSSEINLNGTCSFQLKMWTLNHMLSKGLIGRRIAKKSGNKNYYCYFLKTGRRKHENHNT